MKKLDCADIALKILESNGVIAPEITEHCHECPECRALLKDWEFLSKIEPDTPLVPITLEKAIIGQSAKLRTQSRRTFRVRHISQYAALAAALCIGFILLFNLNPDTPRLAVPSGPSYQWSWAPIENALIDLQNELENSSQPRDSSKIASYDELNIDIILNEINYYEVIL